jgi:hypothetical protein
MTNTARSLLVFGIYVLVTGLTLLLMPNFLLGVFGLPPTEEVWVKVLGIVAICLGLYHVQAARDNNTAYFAMTIWVRLVFALAITALALMTPGYLALVIFGLVDLAGAGWTWFSQTQDTRLAPAKV